MDATYDICLGTYSCLRVKLLFARQLSFFIVTVYVPCSMTVSVSWMSFWLDHKAVSCPRTKSFVFLFCFVYCCYLGVEPRCRHAPLITISQSEASIRSCDHCGPIRGQCPLIHYKYATSYLLPL